MALHLPDVAHTFHVDGVEVTYYDSQQTHRREGTLVLVHGTGGSAAAHFTWLLPMLATRQRVIGLDMAMPRAVADGTRRLELDDLADQVIAVLEEVRPTGPVTLLGYSLGSRLAWEFAAWNPDLVEHLVMGGPGANDMLAGFEIEQARKFLASGEEINDDLTASIMQIVTSEPSNDAEALFKLIEGIKTEPFEPETKVPSTPTLLVAGDHDDLATTMPQLRRLLKDAGTRNEVLWLAGRNHANAVTSREFKEKTLEFLGA